MRYQSTFLYYVQRDEKTIGSEIDHNYIELNQNSSKQSHVMISLNG